MEPGQEEASEASSAAAFPGPVLPKLRGAPPSLSEPLLRLGTGGAQNAFSWVHSALSQLAARLEEQRERQVASEEEAKRERRGLSERVGTLEAFAASAGGFAGHRPAISRRSTSDLAHASGNSPTGGSAPPPAAAAPPQLAALAEEDEYPVGPRPSMAASGRRPSSTAGSGSAEGATFAEPSLGEAQLLELRQLSELGRELERRLNRHEEIQQHRQGTQDNLVALRLEALQQDLAACLRPRDVEAQRQEAEAWRARIEKELPETVQRLGQELRFELQSKADELLESLHAIYAQVHQGDPGDAPVEGETGTSPAVPVQLPAPTRFRAPAKEDMSPLVAQGLHERVSALERLLSAFPMAPPGGSQGRQAAHPGGAPLLLQQQRQPPLLQPVDELEQPALEPLERWPSKGSQSTAMPGSPHIAPDFGALLVAVQRAGEMSGSAMSRVQDLANDVRTLQEVRLRELVEEVEELRLEVQEGPRDSHVESQLRDLSLQVEALRLAMEDGRWQASGAARNSDGTPSGRLSLGLVPGWPPSTSVAAATSASALGSPVTPAADAAAMVMEAALKGGPGAGGTPGTGRAFRQPSRSASNSTTGAVAPPPPTATVPAPGAGGATSSTSAAGAGGAVEETRSMRGTPKAADRGAVPLESHLRALSKEVHSLRSAVEQRAATEALAGEVWGLLEAAQYREGALAQQSQAESSGLAQLSGSEAPGWDPGLSVLDAADSSAWRAQVEGRLAALEENSAQRGRLEDKAKARGARGAPRPAAAAASSAGSAPGASPAQSATSEAAAAVAQIAARAAELERQFEEPALGGAGVGRDCSPAGLRLDRMEDRLDMLEAAMEAARERRMDTLAGTLAPALSGSWGGAGGAAAGTPGARSGSASPVGASPQGGQAQDATAPASWEGRVRDVEREVRGLKEGALKEIVAELQIVRKLSERRAPAADPVAQAAITQDAIIEELDKRSEQRLASIWKKLTDHAQAAATRADKLEQGFAARVGKIEVHIGELVKLENRKRKEDKDDLQRAKELDKLIEWLTWRITWLEWAVKGEERGFGRPLDAKAVLPQPPPYTNVAAAFGQPLTEDMDLWTRVPNGQLRLRRPLQVPIIEVAPQVRASRSTGRLPNITQ